MKYFNLTIALLLSASIYAQTSKLSGDDYSIDYPESWELDQSGQMGTIFILMSKAKSETDGFRENINMLRQNFAALGVDKKDYMELSINAIEGMLTNGKILTNEKLKKDGLEYQKVVYTGDVGMRKLKFIQHYYLTDKSAYVLTFSAEESEFDDYVKQAEKTLDSFELK